MNPAIHKTLSLIVLILIGVLLQRKVTSKEQLKGVKVLILSIALPATIFIALLKINIAPSLLFLPILALGFNLFLFFSAPRLLPLLGIPTGTPAFRTYRMLFPSLAPGLSCFPFIIEYLGEEALAWAALADVGNKVFGLIILYLVAMSWYFKIAAKKENRSAGQSGKLKSLALALVKEPINLVIVLGLILLGAGLNIEALPPFLKEAVQRMNSMMTPLVLLFIGMAVSLQKKELKEIITVLFWRSGFAFWFSAILGLVLPGLSPLAILVLVAFPQSACSFWPFAHMSAVSVLETNEGGSGKNTFQLNLALNILAISLPFSTIIILTICASGDFFVLPITQFIAGCIMLSLSFFTKSLPYLRSLFKGEETAFAKEQSENYRETAISRKP